MVVSRQPAVLVVDDDPQIVRALERTLRREFTVLRASSGDEALQAVRESDVAVVLTDQRMPGMEGVQLLARLQAEAPAIVGILLTAYSDMDAAIAAINQAHAFGYLPKPWEDEELVRVLYGAMEQHELLQRQSGDMAASQQREIGSLAALSGAAAGQPRVGEESAASRDRLRASYEDLLDRAVEQRTYRLEDRVTASVRELAGELGAMRAGPRLVVEIHAEAIKGRIAQQTPQRAAAILEEGRLLLVRLLGALVQYYRERLLASRP